MVGSFNHDDDPNTTNLFIGNINPSVNENDLCDVFAAYGPLASVKIMWPRTDEERARNRNSGFVAYMNRQDAELALKSLIGSSIRNYDLRLGWAKQVVIPPMPIAFPDLRRKANAEALLTKLIVTPTLSSAHAIKYSASQPNQNYASSKLTQQELKNEKKDKLDSKELDQLHKLIKNLSTKRKSIGDCMLYCINHSYAANQVIEQIYNSIMKLSSMSNEDANNFEQILSKIYLISDILHNCSAQVPNASYYRGAFKSKLMDIFGHVAKHITNISDCNKLNESKEKILAIFKAWKDWTLYEDEFLVELSGIALNITTNLKAKLNVTSGSVKSSLDETKQSDINSNIDTLSDNIVFNTNDLDGLCINNDQLKQCLNSKGLTLDWYKSLGLMDELDLSPPMISGDRQPVVLCNKGFDEVDFYATSKKHENPSKSKNSFEIVAKSEDNEEWKAKRAAFKTTKWDTIEPDEDETTDEKQIQVTSLSEYHDIADHDEFTIKDSTQIDTLNKLSAKNIETNVEITSCKLQKEEGDKVIKRDCNDELESSKLKSPLKRAKFELKEEGEIDSSDEDANHD